jgi:hypothetical protein
MDPSVDFIFNGLRVPIAITPIGLNVQPPLPTPFTKGLHPVNRQWSGEALIDTGKQESYFNLDAADQLGLLPNNSFQSPFPSVPIVFRATVFLINPSSSNQIHIPGTDFVATFNLPIGVDAILGRDLLVQLAVSFNGALGTLSIQPNPQNL